MDWLKEIKINGNTTVNGIIDFLKKSLDYYDLKVYDGEKILSLIFEYLYKNQLGEYRLQIQPMGSAVTVGIYDLKDGNNYISRCFGKPLYGLDFSSIEINKEIIFKYENRRIPSQEEINGIVSAIKNLNIEGIREKLLPCLSNLLEGLKENEYNLVLINYTHTWEIMKSSFDVQLKDLTYYNKYIFSIDYLMDGNKSRSVKHTAYSYNSYPFIDTHQ